MRRGERWEGLSSAMEGSSGGVTDRQVGRGFCVGYVRVDGFDGHGCGVVFVLGLKVVKGDFFAWE